MEKEAQAVRRQRKTEASTAKTETESEALLGLVLVWPPGGRPWSC
jgi:hypothetical protein